MRRRSNAIHSESEQEYMLLAEFSQERAGYFYDEKFRQEVDKKINRHKEILVGEKRQDKKEPLLGFDYNPEEQQRVEEEAEINQGSTRKQVVIAVIVDYVTQAAFILADLFGTDDGVHPKGSQRQQERALDLFLLNHPQALFKIWIIQQCQTHNPLFQPYLKHASQLIHIPGPPSLIANSLPLQLEELIEEVGDEMLD